MPRHHKRDTAPGGSQRQLRVGETVRHAIADILSHGSRDAGVVLAALERNKKFLRGEIARRVNLKFAPDVRFRVDERFDEAERIEKLLRTPAVQRDLAPNPPESEE